MLACLLASDRSCSSSAGRLGKKKLVAEAKLDLLPGSPSAPVGTPTAGIGDFTRCVHLTGYDTAFSPFFAAHCYYAEMSRAGGTSQTAGIWG